MKKVAILIPAYNEEQTIKNVILDFNSYPNKHRDGLKVILTIFDIFRSYKPMQFFSLISLFLLILGLIVGVFPVSNYIETRYVEQVPMAILAVGLVVLSALSFSIGLILSSVRRYQNINFEISMLHYAMKYETYNLKIS